MAVLIKRSDLGIKMVHECDFGCCSPLNTSNAKDVKAIRRAIKRSERQRVKKDFWNY